MSLKSFYERGSTSNGPSHRRSKVQEKSIAKKFGGKITPGSGNKDTKGDVRVCRIVRIEAKTTMNKSFSVTREMVRKIEEAALMAEEAPAIIIEFNDGLGKVLCEVAVVPTYVIQHLIEGGNNGS